MRDTYRAVIQHCGGDGAISELERMAARRIGALEAELVHMESRFGAIRAEGGEPDAISLDLYQRMANSQRRCCESIGWQRRQRNITPSLREYLTVRAELGTETRTSEAPRPDSVLPESDAGLTGELDATRQR
jgi:hypothetical protein